LQSGPNNNFAKFKEALSNKAWWEYGAFGSLFESGKYFVPEPPDLNHYDLVNDPLDKRSLLIWSSRSCI
jgi:hypothetical protein